MGKDEKMRRSGMLQFFKVLFKWSTYWYTNTYCFYCPGRHGYTFSSILFPAEKKADSECIQGGTALRYFLSILPLLVIYIHTSSLRYIP